MLIVVELLKNCTTVAPNCFDCNAGLHAAKEGTGFGVDNKLVKKPI